MCFCFFIGSIQREEGVECVLRWRIFHFYMPPIALNVLQNLMFKMLNNTPIYTCITNENVTNSVVYHCNVLVKSVISDVTFCKIRSAILMEIVC